MFRGKLYKDNLRLTAENALLQRQVETAEKEDLELGGYKDFAREIQTKVGEISVEHGINGNLEKIFDLAIARVTEEQLTQKAVQVFDSLPPEIKWGKLAELYENKLGTDALRQVIDNRRAREVAKAEQELQFGDIYNEAREKRRLDLSKLPLDAEIVLGFLSSYDDRGQGHARSKKHFNRSYGRIAREVTGRMAKAGGIMVTDDRFRPNQGANVSYSFERWEKDKIADQHIVRFGTRNAEEGCFEPVLYQGNEVRYTTPSVPAGPTGLDLSYVFLEGVELFQ